MNNKDGMVGVILAAGRGVRFSPHRNHISKVLLELNGQSLLQRNIEIMRDQLGINKIFIVAGYHKDKIIELFGDGKKLNVSIQYIINKNVENGLVAGLLLAKSFLNDTFCLMLGDEFYSDSNHNQLLAWNNQDFLAVCAIKQTTDNHLIKKNYTVDIKGGLITTLIEKPQRIFNSYIGCGTFLLHPKFFDFIAKTPPSRNTRKKELAEVINTASNNGEKIYPFFIDGDYVNINSIDDFNYAKYLIRCKNFKQKKISLVIPTYNEQESIECVLTDFKNKVDEILIMDNNSSDATAEIAKRHGANLYSQDFEGYGDAIKKGLDKASGDILIIVEADGSFKARDLDKILEYLKDADMVLGTRTTKQMIESAANMGFLLRWGNVCVAKLIEILWWAKHQPRLTDVGCTYRGIWKDAYERISNNLSASGPAFSPEMIIEAMNHDMRIIEIPVTYCGRIGGISKLSGSFTSSLKTGLNMLKLIVSKRLQSLR